MATRVTGPTGSLRIASIRPAGPSKKVLPAKSVNLSVLFVLFFLFRHFPSIHFSIADRNTALHCGRVDGVCRAAYGQLRGTTMKTLLLLRHAKSSWDDSSLRDFERPLAGRGKRDAPRIGKAFRKRGPLPDLIVSSPAARAKATVEAVIKAAKLVIEAQFDEALYGLSLIHI